MSLLPDKIGMSNFLRWVSHQYGWVHQVSRDAQEGKTALSVFEDHTGFGEREVKIVKIVIRSDMVIIYTQQYKTWEDQV